MATEAIENRILDKLLEAAQLVVGGATYNTNPAIKQLGVSLDALPQGGSEGIYIQHVRTVLKRRPTGPSHDFEAVFHAWCVGDSDREVLNVKDDLLRAVWSKESELMGTGLARHGFIEGECFIPDPETLAKIGKAVRVQEFFGQYQLTHA